jgi:eukaryotic-like serine/threonine-protein kinase
MGEVLAAVDELLGREVAVKTLKGRSSGLAARIADERFRLEARAIASFTHPSVVQVYDLDITADPPYLVMERVAGPSLKERIAQGVLSEPEVRALGIQIANAIAAAHACGVVHRDVKPANILAAGPGRWKLADFGVAHVPESSLTMTGQFVGSPAYAPPEALLRGQLGPEGDVFSLGATLYEAAAGTWPRAGAEMRGLVAPVPPIRSIAPGVSPELAAAIDRAVSVEPADRQSASEVALALAGASVAGVPATPPAGVPAANVSGVPATPPAGVPAVAITGARSSGTAEGPTATSTAYVPDHPAGTLSLAAGAGASTVAAPAGRSRWKLVAIGIAALLVVVLVVIVVTRSSPSAPTGATVTNPGAQPEQGATSGSDERDNRDNRDTREEPGNPENRENPENPDDRENPDDPENRDDRSHRQPGPIQARTPPGLSAEAYKAWRKIVDSIYERRLDDARRKLAEFEARYGETPQSRDLASQLDAARN